MKDVKIKQVFAYHQFDSRGFPTVAVQVIGDNGLSAKALVPSGASTGIKEAVELRDGKKDEFLGKGVSKAIKNVNSIIAPKVKNKSVFDQRKIDDLMIKLDGTPNKGKLGANAILAVSLAVAHLAAKSFKRFHMPSLDSGRTQFLRSIKMSFSWILQLQTFKSQRAKREKRRPSS